MFLQCIFRNTDQSIVNRRQQKSPCVTYGNGVIKSSKALDCDLCSRRTHIKPNKPNGVSIPYTLGESIYHLGARYIFFILFYLYVIENPVSKQWRPWADDAASDQGLHCLPMSHTKRMSGLFGLMFLHRKWGMYQELITSDQSFSFICSECSIQILPFSSEDFIDSSPSNGIFYENIKTSSEADPEDFFLFREKRITFYSH